MAFDFDGAEVIVRRGRPSRPPAREAPRPLRLGRAGPGLPLRHPPPRPPTHYDDDGTQRPARAGVAAPTWMGQPPLGQEQSAPVFAAWEAAHGQPDGAPSATPAADAGNGAPSGRPAGPAIETLSAHRGATSPAATASPRPSATGPPSRPRPGGASCWPSATPRPRTPSIPGCA